MRCQRSWIKASIKAWIKVVLTLGMFLGAASALSAQLTEGTIAVTVRDASGGAVANAKVEVTNSDTGVAVNQATDNIGYARVLHLEPGHYLLKVEAPGFKASVVESVAVSVNVITPVDVTLQVGSVQETVEVSTAAPLVQVEEARLENTITNREVTDLPLNGRDVYQLITLEPGVTATNAPVVSNVSSPTSSTTFNDGFIANGSTPRGNNFILDGNSNNNEWLGGTPLIFPGLDAIQEVQVQTLNFSAEYGRNDGAIVNVITRSGSNAFHGDVFYTGREHRSRRPQFLRSDGQDAAAAKSIRRRSRWPDLQEQIIFLPGLRRIPPEGRLTGHIHRRNPSVPSVRNRKFPQ